MLVVLSPAKKLDYDTPIRVKRHSIPDFASESARLVKHLRTKSARDLQKLMGISDKLAALNHDRYRSWSPDFPPERSRQAVLAFMGDVYAGLDAQTLDGRDLAWAQKHLRILSGLYGLLRPLDLMQPYRLEMGTPLGNARGPDLYHFWGRRLADALNAQAGSQRTRCLVNLASNEYFDAVDRTALELEVVSPAFKEEKDGKHRVLSFFAKKARGMMARYIIRSRARKPGDLLSFDAEGYAFDESQSTPARPVFTRPQP